MTTAELRIGLSCGCWMNGWMAKSKLSVNSFGSVRQNAAFSLTELLLSIQSIPYTIPSTLCYEPIYTSYETHRIVVRRALHSSFVIECASCWRACGWLAGWLADMYWLEPLYVGGWMAASSSCEWRGVMVWWRKTFVWEIEIRWMSMGTQSDRSQASHRRDIGCVFLWSISWLVSY